MNGRTDPTSTRIGGRGHKEADVDVEFEEVVVEFVSIDERPDFEIIELPEIPEMGDFDEVEQQDSPVGPARKRNGR